MTRKNQRNYENLPKAIEDSDATRLARETMAVSQSREASSAAERRAANLDPGGAPSSYDDEEQASAADAIPPLPQATPIPGHSRAVTEERLHAQGAEPRDAREAMPATGNYGKLDAHAFPDGPEARKSFPLTLLSGALAAPVAAVRFAGHALSKAACRLGVLRQRGEEKWQSTRAKLKTS